METAKDQVQQILEKLPEDASLEDIQYHIYVRQKIEQGLEDAAAGRVISPERGWRVGEFEDPAVRELMVDSYRLIYRVRPAKVCRACLRSQSARSIDIARRSVVMFCVGRDHVSGAVAVFV